MAIYEDQLTQLVNEGPAVFGRDTIASPTEEQLAALYQEQAPSSSGSRLITNVPELRPSAQVYIEPPPVAAPPTQQSSQNQGTGDFITDYESLVMNAPDFMSKQKIINQFADNVQQRLGAAQVAVMKIAEKDVNLDPERRKLRDLMDLDRRNSDLKGIDSEETAKQRARVLNLEGVARKQAEELLKNSPEYTNFTSRAKNSISLQTKMAEKAFNDAEKLAQKEETRRENAQIVSASIDPEARKAITNFNPEMKDDVVFADWVLKGGGKSKDWQPILTGALTSKDYLTATMEGNGAARQLAVSEYSTRTGKSPDEAARTIMQAEMLSKSPDMFASTAAKLGIMTPQAAKDFVAKYNIASSSDRKELNKVMITKIPDIMEASTINYVKTDPTAVAMNLNDPAFVEAGVKAAAKNPNKKPTTYDISLTYINDPTLSNQQKIDRQNKITQAYAAALAKEGSNGILHMPFEKSRLEDESRKFKTSLTVKTVSDTLAKKIGEFMGRATSDAYAAHPLGQLNTATRNVGSNIMEAGDAFFSGFSQGGNQ